MPKLQILMVHEAVTTAELDVTISDTELRVEVESSRAAHLADGLA